jgi:amino acid adenylation domain-containing protein
MIPLSPAQQRLWLLSQIDGPSSSYNIAIAMRMGGRLDRPALREALNDVVRRHEVLRTVLPAVAGQPRQHILRAAEAVVPLAEQDCPPGRLHETIAAAADAMFDLGRDLPLRARLLAAGPDDHVLVLVLHHVAADGWSLGPLCADLGTAYAARAEGKEPGWAELPVQYSDYALWQRELLGSEADPDSLISRQLAYWTRTLDGLPWELNLPRDRPRPARGGSPGDTVHFEFSAATHAGLARVARDGQATLFMVVQAGLAALLTRLGAGCDIPLGSPVAGRDEEVLEDLVGFFVNTLVLRTDTSGNPRFTELVERVRAADLAAYARQDVPFERVVEAVNPARSPGRHPLFQVMLAMQQQRPGAETGLPGLATSVEQVANGTAKFDLQFGLVERPGEAGIGGGVEYSTAQFDRETAELITGRLVRLLDAVAADPATRISQIGLLGPAERARIAAAQHGAEHPVPPGTVVGMIRAQAERTPDAIALTSSPGLEGGSRVSYAAMVDRAVRLAERLAAYGAAPGRSVAVLLPRGADLVIAMLASMMAGAAYVPADPGLPPARMALMMEDAVPAVAVAAPGTAVPGGIPAIPPRAPGPPAPACLPGGDGLARPDQPAYVIYTSGSTGRPKGVVIEHGALAAYLTWCRENYPGLRDSAPVHTSVSYDMTVTALFGPLICGGRVELDDALAQASGPGLLKITPSHLELLAGPAACASPRDTLVLGGEALYGEPLRNWRCGREHVTVINEYGPTEATVGCVTHRIGPGEPIAPGAVPIGRPIWNTGAYVLDEELRPAPAGVPGELYISGRQLARGYLNQPGLTAERFVADPYGPPGTRMYRTGDLARRRPDGTLEYLGRRDDQVKVRGFRIETGEIEHALRQHPGVRQAAVTLREDRPGDQRLTAYVVSDAADLDHGELRAGLARTLPAQLIPAAFVRLDALPVTPNGKLDRAALPAPHYCAGARSPRTRRERVLRDLFAEALGLPEVGIDDGFFEAGGHSLLALRLCAAVGDRLGTSIGIRDLFAAPTVAQLSALLDRKTAGPAGALAPLLPLRESGSGTPLWCLPPASGVSWVYAGLLGHIDAVHPVYGLQSPSLGGAHADLGATVGVHLAQITGLQPAGPYRLLGWSFGATVAHALAVALQDLGAQVGPLVLLDGYPAGWAPAVPGDPLGDLLASLGYQAASPEESLAAARAPGGVLAGLDDDSVAALIRTFGANASALAQGTSGVYRGDALLFTSADGAAAPDAWRDHITGRLDVCPVPARHGQMTGPVAVRHIGPVLANQLH